MQYVCCEEINFQAISSKQNGSLQESVSRAASHSLEGFRARNCLEPPNKRHPAHNINEWINSVPRTIKQSTQRFRLKLSVPLDSKCIRSSLKQASCFPPIRPSSHAPVAEDSATAIVLHLQLRVIDEFRLKVDWVPSSGRDAGT